MNESRARADSGSLLRVSCWLALLLVIAKALSWNDAQARDFSLVTVFTASWSDALFALVCGAIGELTLWLLSRWPRAAETARRVYLGFYALFAGYAFAAIGIFKYFNRPLTFPLLTLISNAAAVRSSIAERLTWPIAISMIAAPLLLLWLATRVRRGAWTPALLAVALLWIGVGFYLHGAEPETEKRQHLRRSPHFELLRTTAARLRGGRRPPFPNDFPAEYKDEFRTSGARGITELRHFTLPEGVQRPRNTIVIVLESVGTKYLGLYGHSEEITPNITAAAANALVFDNIYAHASFTYASFRPINFSVYPGLPWHYSLVDANRPVPRTLASALASRGSRAAYFTSGDLDWGDQRGLLQRAPGYDIVQGAHDLGCPLISSWGTSDKCLFDRLISWIDEDRQKPFFAVCWTDQTHDPYRLGPSASGLVADPEDRSLDGDRRRYLAALRMADEQVGRVFTALRERGLADDTLVVITGDHGEAFADPHGQRGHAWTVFDEETRVPLLIWNPRLFPSTQRVPTVGGHVDLNATLADILDVPPDREWQGRSLFDPAHPNRTFLMAIAGGDVFGVRDGRWKYIYDVTTAEESLFDLNVDPTEQTDVAAREPLVSLELRRRVAAWVAFEEAFLWGREN